MIEFVFVAPLFLMIMLGAIDWGWYFVLRETVVNATREGARTASVQETETEAQEAGETAVQEYLTRAHSAAAAIRVQAPVVTFADVAVPGVATPVRAVSVRLLAYPSPPITGLSLTLVPTTITAETVMRLEVQPPAP
jgi:Flp pilus assembly protein TadG